MKYDDKLKIYLVERTDTVTQGYKSMVVAQWNEGRARRTYPETMHGAEIECRGNYWETIDHNLDKGVFDNQHWIAARDIDTLKVTHIGYTNPEDYTATGVILSSFIPI